MPTMEEPSSNPAISLPTAQKLDGAKDYLTWKANMVLLMKSARLWPYIDSRRRLTFPARVEWNHPISEDLEAWEKWEANDCRAQLAISVNIIDSESKSIVHGKSTALEMWEALEQQYEGKGHDDKYNAIVDYTSIKYETYNNLDAYIAAFRTNVDKVRRLKLYPDSAFWDPVLFINGLGTAFPIWAEHQRNATRNEETPATVDELVADIFDEFYPQQFPLSGEDMTMHSGSAKRNIINPRTPSNSNTASNSAIALASFSLGNSNISRQQPSESETDPGISVSQVRTTQMQAAASQFPAVSTTTLARRPDATIRCSNPEHRPHEPWPEEDTANVRVLFCERSCQYCDHPKQWPNAAALRKHVTTHLITFDVIRELRGTCSTAYKKMVRNGITPPIRYLSSKEEEPIQASLRRPYHSKSARSSPLNVHGARIAKSTRTKPRKPRKPICGKLVDDPDGEYGQSEVNSKRRDKR